jgi:hypothetical protein
MCVCRLTQLGLREFSKYLKNVECFNCGKKGYYSTNCSAPRKKAMKIQTLYPKRISKIYFNLIERHVDQKGKNKEERQHVSR